VGKRRKSVFPVSKGLIVIDLANRDRLMTIDIIVVLLENNE